MISQVLACSILALSPLELEFEASSLMHYHDQAGLTRDERESIYREIHFCIKKMNIYLDRAEREARQIRNVDIRDATVGAVEGAIAGVAGQSAYSIVIGGCLGALSRIGGESYRHFLNCQDLVYDSRFYADKADKLQERLWRNQ